MVFAKSKLPTEFVALILAALVFASPAVAAEKYDVEKLGAHIYAMGINERGQVVGYVQPGATPQTWYAFLWQANTGIVSLGGYMARSINEQGQIAGNSAQLQAAVWENGSWIPLPNRQNAYAINDHGQVTGLISAQPSIPGPYAPFRDDDIYVPSFIVLERPYPAASHGFDINNSGEVVADCGLPGQLYGAVFYGADANYVILDDDGNYDAHARSINDVGQIVGDTRTVNGTDRAAAFWGSPDSPIEYMGDLGVGAGVAFAINNVGEAVGYSADTAFVWTAQDGMSDLNDLIDPKHNILLTRAFDINDNGVIITWGFDPAGQEGSYILTPRTRRGPALNSVASSGRRQRR